ncbi:hypothetical protein [Consotaella salsifontis]|uniref:Stress-response A/B barrel domain-containing protein n=1 Tax=Consotaella salsifontis TaxID=1365950 RepID=A0A1T4TAJ4_9HYPH|nr:hypothetical protein [Consotaella salsifontis]SKA37407.1 hypothetical protein SAMN05428963_12230 [Consotaella salsifontis]
MLVFISVLTFDPAAGAQAMDRYVRKLSDHIALSPLVREGYAGRGAWAGARDPLPADCRSGGTEVTSVVMFDDEDDYRDYLASEELAALEGAWLEPFLAVRSCVCFSPGAQAERFALLDTPSIWT